MNYKAPDGTIIKSKSTKVEYKCNCEGISNGIYVSYETTGAITDIGIVQIKIIRTVNDNKMDISIEESSEAELIEYKEKYKYKEFELPNPII